MKKHFMLWIAGVLFFCASAQPATISEQNQNNGAAILRSIQEKYSPKVTFESAFDLTIYWAVREKEEKRTGKIFWAPGDKFRVETNSTIWVSDGATFWQYSKKSNQVEIKRLADENVSMLPTQLISTYLNTFRFTLVQDLPQRCLLEGTPDSAHARSDVASLLLTIDKKADIIAQIAVVDKDANKSTYFFKKSRFGAPVAAKVFEFVAPAGANVIDAR
ncbi:MAG: outer membrane lipoprotein carrier protein LolA [Chitinivibrionales bacterium]|nr:outer membrane lipoprotein carrier protein LolA [Chitinivibrionales bacterium]